jgi:hypothetical protein
MTLPVEYVNHASPQPIVHLSGLLRREEKTGRDFRRNDPQGRFVDVLEDETPWSTLSKLVFLIDRKLILTILGWLFLPPTSTNSSAMPAFYCCF